MGSAEVELRVLRSTPEDVLITHLAVCVCECVCVCKPHHLATIRRLSRGPADGHDQLAEWTTVQLNQSRPEADGGWLLLRLTFESEF